MSESSGNISYQPTDGLSYDPSERKYWDKDALSKEITRAFEICHGCRMCFKFCDTFPDLFGLLDKTYDGDVRKITEANIEALFDACFQCKLCDVNCPYTPRDGHEYMLDFPKLVHRSWAIRARERGVKLTDRVLADPDGAAKLARMSLGMANVANRIKPHRWMIEKEIGIHRDKLLPAFAESRSGSS